MSSGPGGPILFHMDARFFHTGEDGRVHCDLCPRGCRLSDGQRGFCFVRMAEGGRLVLTTYGRSTGFCVDPIEKKPLNHFLPGTGVLSFGTAGCNLGCRFCQNWGISKARETARLSDHASPEGIARAALRSGARSVAYTYNDPVPFAEYVIDTAIACHEQGIRNVAVTAAYVSEGAREALFAHMDAANVDLKAFSDRFYRKLCGGRLQPVLDTLEWLVRETDVWVEVTTLVIPGENDSPEELARQFAWHADRLGPDVPLHLTAFHPDFRLVDRPPTPGATLTRARELARAHGLRHVYTGNVHDEAGQSTSCAACGARLIGRDWYRLIDWRVSGGACGQCGERLPGVFEDAPGRWGPRRQPVFVGE